MTARQARSCGSPRPAHTNPPTAHTSPGRPWWRISADQRQQASLGIFILLDLRDSDSATFPVFTTLVGDQLRNSPTKPGSREPTTLGERAWRSESQGTRRRYIAASQRGVGRIFLGEDLLGIRQEICPLQRQGDFPRRTTWQIGPQRLQCPYRSYALSDC